MPYLRETLASMAAQTYPFHRVLAWDAGSTDGSLEILNQWIPAKIPGRVVSEDQNQAFNPLGENRRKMLLQTETELCVCLDSDDISMPDRLERQVERMLQKPSLVLLGTSLLYIDENGRPTGGRWDTETGDADLRWRSKWAASFGHPAVMFRRSAALAAGNYRGDVRCEDMDLWNRLSLRGEVENLPDFLVHYRRHSRSISANAGDLTSVRRETAAKTADVLFAGLSGARAMELWEASYPDGPLRGVRWRHLTDLRRTAVRFAERLGLRAGYFTDTELFKHQIWQMRRSYLHGLGLRPALDAYSRLRGQREARGTGPG